MSTGDDGLRAHLSEAIAHTDPTLRDRLRTEPAAYLDLVALTARARDETDALLRLAVAGARAAGTHRRSALPLRLATPGIAVGQNVAKR